MNKLHVLCGFLALAAAVACHPIGPPGSRPAPRRTAPGAATHAAAAPVHSVEPLPSPVSPATGSTTTTPTESTPPVQTAARPSPPPTAPPTAPAPAPSLPLASKPATPKDPHVTAQKAPNKAGYVLSPHTGKLVLVDGIPSGVVVPDQTCPPGEKKFFRVP